MCVCCAARLLVLMVERSAVWELTGGLAHLLGKSGTDLQGEELLSWILKDHQGFGRWTRRDGREEGFSGRVVGCGMFEGLGFATQGVRVTERSVAGQRPDREESRVPCLGVWWSLPCRQWKALREAELT